jgi:hypothetical protein
MKYQMMEFAGVYFPYTFPPITLGGETNSAAEGAFAPSKAKTWAVKAHQIAEEMMPGIHQQMNVTPNTIYSAGVLFMMFGDLHRATDFLELVSTPFEC